MDTAPAYRRRARRSLPLSDRRASRRRRAADLRPRPNALPPAYGSLGLPREALDRHIAYDIGAPLTRRSPSGWAPGGAINFFAAADRPQPRRRRSDAGDALFRRRHRAGQRPRRRPRNRTPRERYWAPYREPSRRRSKRCWRPARRRPSSRSIRSRRSGAAPARPWKVGVLWDRDDRLPGRCARSRRDGSAPADIGDNEPYAGGWTATHRRARNARGLANALIEIRQDLIADGEGALAGPTACRLLAPILADPKTRSPRDFGSRTRPARRPGI